MTFLNTLVLSLLSMAVRASQDFPAGFKFGAASAAYQIEGGWNADGKGENIWDRLVHTTSGFIVDGSNADISADSYHLWREDIKMAAQLKLDYYRFSISWSRILPTGLPNKINKAGVKYYNDIINELIELGIEPVVTMYHWDLPVRLQDLGGWTNPLISDWFESYVDVLYRLYADRVKTWLTINEAICVCDFAYNLGNYAPGILETDLAPFLCNKNILMAHAKAYRLYERNYKNVYGGRISLANNVLWIDPFEVPRDLELAELGRQHMIGRYAHPIFSQEGGWPPLIEKQMLKYSLEQGHNSSKLPAFTEEEKTFIRGTADFFGLNYYTARQIRPARPGERGAWFLSGSPEINAMLEMPSYVTLTSSPMIPLYPEGLAKMLSYLRKTYGDIEFWITESGYPGSTKLNDIERIKFIKDHLQQVLFVMKTKKIRVLGYTYWSLMDSFEWVGGYSVRFGFYDVDFNDPKRKRTARLSSKYYSCIIEQNSLNISEECQNSLKVKKLMLPHNTSNKNSINLITSFLLVIFSKIFVN